MTIDYHSDYHSDYHRFTIEYTYSMPEYPSPGQRMKAAPSSTTGAPKWNWNFFF